MHQDSSRHQVSGDGEDNKLAHIGTPLLKQSLHLPLLTGLSSTAILSLIEFV